MFAKPPLPTVLQASIFSTGSTKITPFSFNFLIDACVIGFSSILSFAAGAMMIGAFVVINVSIKTLSQKPAANLFIVFTLAGATTTRSILA